MRHNYPLAIFMVLLLAIIGVSKCAAQAPDADSLAAVWPATSVSYAEHVNPGDSTNYIQIWYNVEGASRIVRYYEGDQLTWAKTLEQGWVEIDDRLRAFYDGWTTDPAFADKIQALVTDFSVINYNK